MFGRCIKCNLIGAQLDAAQSRIRQLESFQDEVNAIHASTVNRLKDELEAERHKGTYKLDVSCLNCEHSFTLWLPQGQTLADAKSVCERCGCPTLEKRKAIPMKGKTTFEIQHPAASWSNPFGIGGPSLTGLLGGKHG